MLPPHPQPEPSPSHTLLPSAPSVRPLQALRDAGMWDETVLLFTSDNGGNPVAGGMNYDFRGLKSTAWEGGVRVPGFIRAPARYGFPARDFSGMVHVADWMPTFLSLAGLKNGKWRLGMTHAPGRARAE